MAYDRRDALLSHETGVLPGSHYFISTREALHPELLQSLITCGNYRCNEQYEVSRPFHEYPLLAAVLEGELFLEVEGKGHTAQKGDIVCCDCQSPHRYGAHSHVEFAWLHPAGHLSRQLCTAVQQAAGPVLRTSQNPRVQGDILRIIVSFQNHSPLPVAEMSAALYGITCTLYDETQESRQMAGNQLLMAAIKYMRYNLENPLTEEDIAAALGLQTQALAAVFQKGTGQGPLAYLQVLRLGLARHLLATTEDPVKAIAQAVGFSDEAHFTALFEAEVGLPPAACRAPHETRKRARFL